MHTIKNKKDTKYFICWICFALTIMLIDQVSKAIILTLLKHGDSYYITNFFNLLLIYNSGAAFGFLSDSGGWQRWFFTIIAMFAMILILFFLFKEAKGNLMSLSFSLILGGAAGNTLDRFFYGYVIDFLDFHCLGMHWPTFNFADSTIFIGAVLFLAIDLQKDVGQRKL